MEQKINMAKEKPQKIQLLTSLTSKSIKYEVKKINFPFNYCYLNRSAYKKNQRKFKKLHKLI